MEPDPIASAAALVAQRLPAGVPAVVALAGPVAAGKSTVARALAEALASRGADVRLVGCDAFLLSNAELERRGLSARKGFPETFDVGAIAACAAAFRRREARTVPVYSHAVYDVVAGETASVAPGDVLLLEGVNALQPDVARLADVCVYVEADEDHVRRWYRERFADLTARARAGEASFYARFAAMSDDQVRRIADSVWDTVNAVNLREHIEPSRAMAHIVVRKGPGHEVVGVTVR